MGESKFMQEVEAYYSDAAGQYPELAAHIRYLRDDMLKERAEADKARYAYQAEERKLDSAQRRLERTKESIRQQKERRREVARSSAYSDDTKEESLDRIDSEIQRLEDEEDSIRDEIKEIKNARDLYQYEEGTHQETANRLQNALKKACKDCGKLAKSLSMHAEVAKFEADKTLNQARGFSNASSVRYARGATQNAQADRTSTSGRYATLASQLTSLAGQYARLAQTDCGEESGSSSKNSESSKGSYGRGREVAIAAVAAVSMISGAAYHATRPIETFDSDFTPMQVMSKRIEDIDEALTGPDQIIEDRKKREELNDEIKRQGKKEAWKY